MQILFKKHTLLLFLVCISFFVSFILSCNTKKEDKNETQTEQKIDANNSLILENTQFSKEDENFDSLTTSASTKEQAEQSYQESQKIISINEIINKKQKIKEKQNTFIKKIAKLTQLGYYKVQTIKNKKGLKEIEKIINTLPENEAKKEAQRLTLLMRFDRVNLTEEAKNYLLTKKNTTLSEKEQLEIYLNTYTEAALLHSDFEEKIKINTNQIQKSQQLAELTNLNFEKLALIESQLGLLGLRSVVLNIPNFPRKEESLKIISK